MTKEFEAFPHIDGRFGHRVLITVQEDKSRCDFLANEVHALGENAVGLLERAYNTVEERDTIYPGKAEAHVSGWVNFDGVMHCDVAPFRKGYLCLVGKESVKDFAGLMIWIHAKCMQLMEEK